MSITLKGSNEFQAKLERLKQNATSIERAGVRAACAVMANGCRDAVPGRIKEEIGFHVKTEGDHVEGRAGLMRFPRRGDGPDGPHGIYPDQGTKFIAARNWIRTALRASRSRALAAMRRAIKGRIRATISQ